MSQRYGPHGPNKWEGLSAAVERALVPVHDGNLGMSCGSTDPDPAHWTVTGEVTCPACQTAREKSLRREETKRQELSRPLVERQKAAESEDSGRALARLVLELDCEAANATKANIGPKRWHSNLAALMRGDMAVPLDRWNELLRLARLVDTGDDDGTRRRT